MKYDLPTNSFKNVINLDRSYINSRVYEAGFIKLTLAVKSFLFPQSFLRLMYRSWGFWQKFAIFLYTRRNTEISIRNLEIRIQFSDFLVFGPSLLRLLSSCGGCWQKFVRQTFWSEKNFSNGQLWNNAPEALLLLSPAQNKRRIRKQLPKSQGHKFRPKNDPDKNCEISKKY